MDTVDGSSGSGAKPKTVKQMQSVAKSFGSIGKKFKKNLSKITKTIAYRFVLDLVTDFQRILNGLFSADINGTARIPLIMERQGLFHRANHSSCQL